MFNLSHCLFKYNVIFFGDHFSLCKLKLKTHFMKWLQWIAATSRLTKWATQKMSFTQNATYKVNDKQTLWTIAMCSGNNEHQYWNKINLHEIILQLSTTWYYGSKSHWFMMTVYTSMIYGTQLKVNKIFRWFNQCFRYVWIFKTV